MVDVASIRKARETIAPFIHRTPLVYSRSFSEMTGAEVYLKAENLQKTGSFKVRGAFNRIAGLKGQKVIAASMGNHAQGIAYAARRLGIVASVVMPRSAPLVKEEATKGYGAEVIIHGESLSDALAFALGQKDCVFVHAFDDDEVICGQGTAGLEILDEAKDFDAVIVPVGGGGLISGIAAAVKSLSPKTEVIGVQASAAPSAYLSFREKRIIGQDPLPTIADGISVGTVGEKTFALINRYVDDIVTVREDSIAFAILLLLERKKLVVEGAGAVPLALLLEEKERFRGKRIVLVISGGNIDFTLIDRIIQKGLATSGRISVIEVILDDLPGSLSGVTGVIAAYRGNILHVVHDRYAGDLPLGKTRVTFTVETRGRTQAEEIAGQLASRGFTASIRE